MAGYYLKGMTVPVPAGDGMAVIRNGRTVEYEVRRIYRPGSRDTRVKRKVIGKIDPRNPARMFPNETYFALFPENGVDAETREQFLRDCRIRRDIAEARRNPEDTVRRVLQGLRSLGQEGEMRLEKETARGAVTMHGEAGDGSQADYMTMMKMFDLVYTYIGELAMKYPNDVVPGYKVRMINRVLAEMRERMKGQSLSGYLELIEEPREEEDGQGNIRPAGRTYSDVMLLLKWYESMPR